MDRYDVVVVGAGPAGATAAGHLAAAGWSTLLIDKEEFPREKTCGDFVAQPCRDELVRLGATPDEIDPIGFPINRMMTLEWPSGPKGALHLDIPVGWTCERRAFDALVQRQALERGAVWLGGYYVRNPLVENGCVVGVRGTYQESELTIEARLVIAAEGAASHLASRLHLTAYDPDCVEVAGRAYFEGVSGLTPTLELYFRPDMGLHYAWVFPMSEQVANVGVGTTVRQCRQWRLNLREVMHRFLREQDGVRQRFSAARQVSEFQSAQIRAGLVGSPTVSDGIMFVGDAAAVADPFTGEGIHQAMVSGRLAAETATQVLDGSRPISAALSPYTTRLDEVYRERYRVLVARARSDTRLYRTLHRLLAPAA